MKKSDKARIIVWSILFILVLACGILGYINKPKDDNFGEVNDGPRENPIIEDIINNSND